MKIDKIFTIASIVTFIALLPALIYLEIRVLQMQPEFKFLLVVIILANVLLIGFIVLEIFLFVRNWKREKSKKPEEKVVKTEIVKEWHNEENSDNT